jgi:hypothetical protein
MKKLIFLIAVVLAGLAIRDKYWAPRDRPRSQASAPISVEAFDRE